MRMDTQRIMQFLHQHKNRLPWLVAILVVLFTISTLLSDIDYFSFKIPKTGLQQSAQHQPVDLSKLHIFGLFSDDFDDLPETQLQLTLQGTGVSNTEPKLSSAIISSPSSQNATIFHIGDNVPGDAMIKDILFDRIVIDNNGELQKLSMKVPQLHNAPASQGLSANSGLSPS